MATVLTPAKARSQATVPFSGGSGRAVNVGDGERTLSAAGGAVLALAGLSRGSAAGLALAALGGGLLYRGLSGHCSLYQALNVDTTGRAGKATAVPAGHGFKVSRSVTIDQPADKLYREWRQFSNLPRFMRHLVSVEEQGNRSHWVARGPVGSSVSWDAEIINEQEGRLIAWRSLPGSQVDTAGSVHFSPTPTGRGTEVRIELKYDPPGGKVGAAIAGLFGESASTQVSEDLNRFKQLMEAGEIASITGQPACQHV